MSQCAVGQVGVDTVDDVEAPYRTFQSIRLLGRTLQEFTERRVVDLQLLNHDVTIPQLQRIVVSPT